MQLCKSAKCAVGIFVLSIAFCLLTVNGSYASQRDRKKVQAQAHYMMGLFYENQEKFDEAITEYKEALSLEKDIASIHVRLASLFIRKSDTAKAILELEEAKKCDPDALEPGLMLALLYATDNSPEKAALEYQEIFGKGNFYLEIGHHPGIKETIKANEGLKRLSAETGIPLVATNDIHYLKKDDADAQDILMLINTGADPNDPERLTLMSDDFSMRSP